MRDPMKRFCRYIRYAGMLLRYALALLIGIFARHTPAYRDLWLFAERGYDAQDNAFFLFQFIRQIYRKISKRIGTFVFMSVNIRYWIGYKFKFQN